MAEIDLNLVEISFFVPCFNEAENISDTLDSIRGLMRDHSLAQVGYEIIVVDDASQDRTNAVVQRYLESHREVPIRFHRNERNCGLGYNYLYWAGQARGRYYMSVNGDNDIALEDFRTIVQSRGQAEIVVPFIINQESRSWIRRFLSKLFVFIVNILSSHRLKYYNGPVLHLRAHIERFKPNTAGFAYQAELLCRALDHGISYLEVPYHSLRRKGGTTSAFRFTNIMAVSHSLWRIAIRRFLQRLFPHKAAMS